MLRAEAEAAGLQVVQQRLERLRMEFFDVGAVVYFLREVIWIVPGFASARRWRERSCRRGGCDERTRTGEDNGYGVVHMHDAPQ